MRILKFAQTHLTEFKSFFRLQSKVRASIARIAEHVAAAMGAKATTKFDDV